VATPTFTFGLEIRGGSGAPSTHMLSMGRDRQRPGELATPNAQRRYRKPRALRAILRLSSPDDQRRRDRQRLVVALIEYQHRSAGDHITQVSNYPTPSIHAKAVRKARPIINYILAGDADVEITMYDRWLSCDCNWSFPGGF